MYMIFNSGVGHIASAFRGHCISHLFSVLLGCKPANKSTAELLGGKTQFMG